jgi:hypothetical protein
VLKPPDDAEPLPFLKIADRRLAETRTSRPDLLRAVLDVFDDADPNERFIDFAKRYIGKAGKDVRVSDINDLQWFFGIVERPALKRLLVWKNVVGRKD